MKLRKDLVDDLHINSNKLEFTALAFKFGCHNIGEGYRWPVSRNHTLKWHACECHNWMIKKCSFSECQIGNE